MAVLGQQGVMNNHAVIAQTTMDKVRVSRGIAKLLKAGLIARVADAEDRRRAILGLTDAGRDTYRKIVPLILDAEASVMAVLSEAERKVLTGTLAKIEAYLDQTDPDADIESSEPARAAFNRSA